MIPVQSAIMGPLILFSRQLKWRSQMRLIPFCRDKRFGYPVLQKQIMSEKIVQKEGFSTRLCDGNSSWPYLIRVNGFPDFWGLCRFYCGYTFVVQMGVAVVKIVSHYDPSHYKP